MPEAMQDVRAGDLHAHLDRAYREAEAVDTGLLAREGLLPTPTEHYLSGTYPPLKALDPCDDPAMLRGTTSTVGLYVHIPFCRQRCTFCHFAKEIRATADRVSRYLDALISEMAMVRAQTGPRTISSIYFGGGTPSTLTPAELGRLFEALYHYFPWGDDAEVTFELHPQVVRDRRLLDEQLAVMSAAGVNRIAFGVQSLDDRVLRTMNRGHTALEALKLVDVLADRGMTNVSVDLMYGLPHETPETWYRTLTTLIERGVDKFNIFPLFLKVTDPITHLFERKPEIFPSAHDRFMRQLFTSSLLESEGFHQGPALYYSREQQHSRQQEQKFDRIDEVDLIGMGVSAFGYAAGSQYYNICDLDEYMTCVETGKLPLWRSTPVADDELARRTAMFSLRSSGIDRRQFQQRFGLAPEVLLPDIDRFSDLGLVVLKNDRWVVSKIGSYCVDGMAKRLASEAVKKRVAHANATIRNPRTSLLEQHDYSPLGRSGSSIAASAGSR